MGTQNQIIRQLRSNVELIEKTITRNPEDNRTAVANKLCIHLHFFDARSKPQLSSCLKALRELDSAGLIALPKPTRSATKKPSPRRLNSAVPAPEAVPESVEDIKDLRIELVKNIEQRKIWNELIIREHPLGQRPLVGRQLRYLVVSEHGYLAAAGFASCALTLRDRDEWMGWDDEMRRDHLDKVVCLSRLLIRPSTTCKNLASHVLSLLTKIFPGDFEKQYGYRPWLLESFIDTTQHNGSSYRAANWKNIGKTSGRGRQDKNNEASQSVKDIYVFPLGDELNQRGLGRGHILTPLEPAEGMCSKFWAENELGAARLGDARLTRRLVTIAQTKGEQPGSPFLDIIRGDRAAAAGYYRFIDAGDESKIDMESILQSHRKRTLGRIKGAKRVLCLHDTTDINYSTLLACEGLGMIGKNQTDTESKGLSLHSSYVVSAEDGVPLGLWDWHCWAKEKKAPPVDAQGNKVSKSSKRIHTPIEEKNSHRWVKNLETCMNRKEDLGDTQVIHVMDREGDFFELFSRWEKAPGNDQLIVRARHDRSISPAKARKKMASDQNLEALKADKIFNAILTEPVKGTIEIEVPRKSQRAKKGKKAAHGKQPKRTATLTLRWMKVSVNPPETGVIKDQSPVEMWLLDAREENPPEGSNPLSWKILTSMPIKDFDEAVEILAFYAKRWRIEDWHRILKTCCRVDEPAHRDAECLKRLIAINMVMAWRIHLMTLLGREVPELPTKVLFSDLEIKVLEKYCESQKITMPSNLGETVILVARLGGYMARKHDPPPGAELLWRGTRKLTTWCEFASFSMSLE